MLCVTDVQKNFGDLRALDGVSLRVDPGEVVCLLGANGAGKTTMMNLCLGLLAADGGEIQVDGVDPFVQASRARKAIAYIPEKVALYPDMSGLDNLAFFDRLSGNRRSSKELLALLAESGLEESAARKLVQSYSKGMRQKVGLAIAAARDAKLLLLDEPMSGLDPSSASDFSAKINELKEQGRAVLMATHDIFRAKECSTRIGIMKAGLLLEMLDPSSMDARDVEQLYLQHIRKGSAL